MRRYTLVAVMVLLLSTVAGYGQVTQAPLNFGNNYFVTGDYVVGGVGLEGSGINGFATGTITIPDANTIPAKGVPPGADIVAALLYWQTVESSTSSSAGQVGSFNGHAITGMVLGNANAPVSWSSGGCSGSSQGSKTIRTYRADVRPYLKLDPTTGYYVNTVSLADSGSNGNTAPFTLGASLVLIYRVVDPKVALNSIVIYDGSYAPSNTSQSMSQQVQGFYEAAASPYAKITHIVGNGQTNKYETVSLINDRTGAQVQLPSLYSQNGTPLPPFPGYYSSSGTPYNGSWDNPTWVLNNVNAEDASETTAVVPAPNNSGCVSWGAVILSTTVQDTDRDGLLDVWENNKGYCDAAVNNGVCSTTDSSWVSLPGANYQTPDIFVELDSMCSGTVNNNSCDTSQGGVSYALNSQAVNMVVSAFTANNHGINVHRVPGNVIQQPPACQDNYSVTPPQLCAFPNQPGVIGWKTGFSFLKNQPLNLNPDGTTWTEAQCEASPAACNRRFQHGRKDSYHYVISGNALGGPSWKLADGTLTRIRVNGGVAIFYTSTPPTVLLPGDPAKGNGRVTIADAISNSNLNGTFLVTAANTTTAPYSFTINNANLADGAYDVTTDPNLSVTRGQAGRVSGFSDLGGQDSLVTLGSWGVDGLSVSVQAGTLMHELGHSIALAHGGYSYATAGSYLTTFGPNCKPNYQSVMNYLFQVDLLVGAQGNSVLDYSEQGLPALDENNASSSNILSSALYATTGWYSPNPPVPGVSTPATAHCDGTPKLPTEVEYRLNGPTSAISWAADQDINFDGLPVSGTPDAALQGFQDWNSVDMRQVGSAGGLSVVPASDGFAQGGGGGFAQGGGGGFAQGGGGGFAQGGGGGFAQGGGGGFAQGGGGGAGELTYDTATSFVRPPRNLAAALSSSPKGVQLSWNPPGFAASQVTGYNVYKGVNTAPAAPPAYSNVSSPFTDTNVTCLGPNIFYNYFVTALAPGLNPGDPQRESGPSNTASISDCVPPYIFTGFYSPLVTADPPNTGSYSGAFNIGKSVTAKWSLQNSSGAFVGNLSANTLYAVGPVQLVGGACLTTNAPVFFNYTYLNKTVYPAPISTLYSPTIGAKGNSTFRISSSNNQFIFNWDTTPFAAGCYVLELDLDSGQVERTALQLR